MRPAPPSSTVPSLAELAQTARGQRSTRRVARRIRPTREPAGKLRRGTVTAVSVGAQGTLLDLVVGDPGEGTPIAGVLSACPVVPEAGDTVWCVQAGTVLVAVASNRQTQTGKISYTLASAAAQTLNVTFPVSFAEEPDVVATARTGADLRLYAYVRGYTIVGGRWTGAVLRVQQGENGAVSGTGEVAWHAAGRV